MPRTRFTTALVLSGGGARALSNIGVLQQIERDGIRVDSIVGASMGAIIGGLYAYYKDINTVAQEMRRFLGSELFLSTLSVATENFPEENNLNLLDRFVWYFKRGVYYTHALLQSTLVSEVTYANLMKDLIPEHPIEDLSLPFSAVAMDAISGEEVVIRTGCLRKALSASSAIPGILPPVQRGERFLVDGGWVDNVPVTPAVSMGAHFVIAVDSATEIFNFGPLPATALDLLLRCDEMSRIRLNQQLRAYADVLLIPDLGQMYWTDFTDLERCIAAGRQCVKKSLWSIRRRKALRQSVTLCGLLHPVRMGNWRRPLVFV